MEVHVLVCCYELQADQAVCNNKLENLQQHSSCLGTALKIPRKNYCLGVRVLVK